jgi:predicted esterase
MGSDEPLMIGSSYGGITALCSAIELDRRGRALTGLVLCAPALGRDEPPATEMNPYAPCPTIIVHGVLDDVVPISVSRELAARDANVELIETDDGHRLAGSLDVIVEAVRRLGNVGQSPRTGGLPPGRA